MTKFITVLLLVASVSSTAVANASEQTEKEVRKNLFEKIFNISVNADGCATYPMCDVDYTISEAEQMVLGEEQIKKLEAASKDDAIK